MLGEEGLDKAILKVSAVGTAYYSSLFSSNFSTICVYLALNMRNRRLGLLPVSSLYVAGEVVCSGSAGGAKVDVVMLTEAVGQARCRGPFKHEW